MKTKIIEGVQSLAEPGNWGKFLVAVPEEEWARRSAVNTDFPGPLLSAIGWSGKHIWVLDLQTGEGAFFRPGGLASYDLGKHAVWVCPLFQPFLEWLYRQCGGDGGLDLDALPDVVELPGAEFAISGYRRKGPPDIVRDLMKLPDELLREAVGALIPHERERLARALIDDAAAGA